ncbi:hypothetical protein C8F01DRAFT_1266556 [Mycena amicta]|nr:hypothetical protein C8F01DRAFT_1266556 [Mycena amicta]
MSSENIAPIFNLKRKEEDDEAPAPSAMAPTTKKKPRASKLRASAASSSAGTCSLTKKEFGDRIKDALRIEKYDVQRMRIDLTMDVAFFRSFFGGHARITPALAEYTPSTPVIVAELSNTQAGDVFGVSKVKNGNPHGDAALAEHDGWCFILRRERLVFG